MQYAQSHTTFVRKYNVVRKYGSILSSSATTLWNTEINIWLGLHYVSTKVRIVLLGYVQYMKYSYDIIKYIRVVIRTVQYVYRCTRSSHVALFVWYKSYQILYVPSYNVLSYFRTVHVVYVYKSCTAVHVYVRSDKNKKVLGPPWLYTYTCTRTRTFHIIINFYYHIYEDK